MRTRLAWSRPRPGARPSDSGERSDIGAPQFGESDPDRAQSKVTRSSSSNASDTARLSVRIDAGGLTHGNQRMQAARLGALRRETSWRSRASRRDAVEPAA